jgi:hypothetical protein
VVEEVEAVEVVDICCVMDDELDSGIIHLRRREGGSEIAM